jgi:hypothetical protein
MKTLVVLLMAAALCSAAPLEGAWHLGYGDGPDQVGFMNANSAKEFEDPVPFGPLAFRVVNGEAWVADSVRARILVLGQDGKVRLTFAVPTDGPGLLEDLAVATDEAGVVTAVFVLRGHSQEIVEFAPTGDLRRTMGGRGDAPGMYIQMHRIEVSKDGHLFVADKGRQTITVVAPDGTVRREAPWQWSGLAVDAAGNLCRLHWNEDEKQNHLIIETVDGTVVADRVLAIGPHLNPELWWVTPAGEAFVTFTPTTGFEGTFGFFLGDPQGRAKKTGHLKPPRAMNRLIDHAADGTVYLGVADYDEAPHGRLAIEPFPF